jgi:hypothetical protein
MAGDTSSRVIAQFRVTRAEIQSGDQLFVKRCGGGPVGRRDPEIIGRARAITLIPERDYIAAVSRSDERVSARASRRFRSVIVQDTINPGIRFIF